MTTPDSDIALIEGCRAGDVAARRELYVRYSRQLLALCYRYTGDIDAAHDVLHDGFLKAMTHFSYRGECALSTWLTRVMTTTAIDYLRRRQRQAQWLTVDETLPDLPADDGPAASDFADWPISSDVLMEMVAQLPEGCRTVLNLFVMEGLSHREIAQVLGIKEHSSTSQLSRAKALLMKKIKQYISAHERE